MKTNAVIAEIIANFEDLQRSQSLVKKPNIVTTNLEHGFDVSAMAMRQPDEVAMTPLMKNALKHFGDLKDGERLKVGSPQTKAEKFFEDVAKRALAKYNSAGASGKYDESKSLTDVAHYDVDCHHNLKEIERDIQPGQQEQREKSIKVFAERKPSNPKVLQNLKHNPVFQRAVLATLDLIPSVRATTEFRQINLPFMTKHTNVSYETWMNDRAIVPGKGITYAELTMQQAMKLKLQDLFDHNVSTAYGRNQRGKGRLLVAIDRRVNLVLNQLESEEISAYKLKSPIFAGYNDDQYLKDVLINMVEYCEANGLSMSNWDYDGYDMSVSLEFIYLLGAMSMFKANGKRSKDMAKVRALLMTKTWLVNGLERRIIEIFGRIFSGFIDTNRGGGLINGTASTHALMKLNPRHSRILYGAKYPYLVMGDDLNFIYDPKNFDAEAFVAAMKDQGFSMSASKYAYGAFFLQWRLMRVDGKYVMAYPWTRVRRSMLWKEVGKGLGPAGWVLAFWQQLFKLIEYKPALSIVVNTLIHFDEMKFGINHTVDEIIQMVQAEDREASKTKTGKVRRRHMSTIDRLYDGDPSKSRFIKTSRSGEVEINKGLLSEIHSAIKEVYKPDFLEDLGFKTPVVNFS